ncbi:restriction endonuclease subunit S [Enterococcus lactis]|uniref:restriction endonuclease subunit S n=1 Tax=Enterococcus lactis TaxID=357441 RepID=UPI0039A45536
MSNDTRPEIRFPGFTEDWEQRKLGGIGKTYTGLTGKSKEDFGHGDAKFVTYMNVFQNPKATLEQLENVEIDPRQNEVKKGDVFFTTSSETPEEVGMSSVWTHDINNIYLNSFTFAYRPTIKFDLDYLAFMLRSQSVRKKIIFLAQGISRYNISKTKMMDISVPIPVNFEEQQKIGAFFKQLDDTIALHQSKLDLLKETKKGFLQKMFPKNGAKVPEIRFPGFTEDWEQSKLGQVANYRRGSFPQPYGNKEWYDGENSMPFVQVVDVGDNLRLVEDTKQKISELAQPKSVFVEEGKVVVTLQGSIGRVAITQYPAYVDRTLLIFENYKAEMDEYYFAYVIQQLFEYEKTRAPGGTIKTITKEALSNFTISFPSIAEQKKLGKFFEQLDDTIALHQRKLDLLKETKKGFLQKMFV